ncbi:MAG: CRTAC1 family protein [Planctomycetes bacterium]|nr:CRTAC1 family protein [Planctomycetota bacterium]
MRTPNPRPAWAFLLCILASACGGDSPSEPAAGGSGQAARAGDDLVRERVAAHVGEAEFSRARELLRPLVERSGATLTDLLAGAAIELAADDAAAAQRFLDRAQKLAPESPAAHYLRGQLARNAGEMRAARDAFRRALAGAPDDLASKLSLAEAEDELEAPAAAERLYREIVAVGPAAGGTWYVAGLYRLRNFLTRAGREEDAARLDPVIRTLEARGLQAPGPVTVLFGELGQVRPPAPAGSRTEPAAAPLAFLARPALDLPAGANWIAARDLDGDLAPDLVVRGTGGISVVRNAAGTFEEARLAFPALSTPPVLFDADNDGDLDLAVFTPEGPVLVVRVPDGYRRPEQEWPEPPAGIAAVIASDYDHEGDLDLLLVGSFGVRVWRNDSVLERSKDGSVTLVRARFTDASEGSGLPATGQHDWILAEDFDGDNDVDYLVKGPTGVLVLDSLRDGRFGPKRGVFDLPPTLTVEPLAADFDGDARTDLWFPGEPSTLVLQGAKPSARAAARVRPGSLAALDLDLDGALDVVWLDAGTGRLSGILALGQPGERALAVAGAPLAGDRLVLADFDGDCRNDLAIESGGRLVVHASSGPLGNGARLAWTGNRDNRRAVGAILELRAGTAYRRVYWRGEPEVLGIGKAAAIDVLRLTWPNGVRTTRLDVGVDGCALAVDPAEALEILTQGSGQVGSCPFLYAWNGSTYGFISDVLGITPLGLRVAPGVFVPPDHDEYVLVRGEQLAPLDGEYVFQFTEELREVTYLDHARLVVVDSPAGTEVFPNELFRFPPFPEARIHALRGAIPPRRALGSDGRDWTAQLLHADDTFPQPMVLHPAQFAGLAQPWFLELEFDAERLPAEGELRLALSGWFYWSDASANMAAARSQGVDFVPPLFQVPDGAGGWRDATPPIGFPAGKTKTMVVDVTPFLDRRDPRLRVVTTLRLYWDRIALFAGADAPISTREIAVGHVESWRRGFSAPLDAVPPGEAHPANRPERFDWQVLAERPRWDQHPGLYTRHGDVTELVRAVDDRFVILGAGDAATLRFPAAGIAPPAPGQRRDFLLYLDGWAKDRDPNTIEALEVEPLPFHGMSGYPYRADERFPDTEVHRAWRREWLQRPAYRWIEPVSPRREVEWVLEGS